jgi:hypothetical protein
MGFTINRHSFIKPACVAETNAAAKIIISLPGNCLSYPSTASPISGFRQSRLEWKDIWRYHSLLRGERVFFDRGLSRPKARHKQICGPSEKESIDSVELLNGILVEFFIDNMPVDLLAGSFKESIQGNHIEHHHFSHGHLHYLIKVTTHALIMEWLYRLFNNPLIWQMGWFSYWRQ